LTMHTLGPTRRTISSTSAVVVTSTDTQRLDFLRCMISRRRFAVGFECSSAREPYVLRVAGWGMAAAAAVAVDGAETVG
jgi:hypothetical protein